MMLQSKSYARAAPARPSRRMVAVRAAAAIPKWPKMYEDLKQRPKLTVTPEEAASLVASGKFAFVDVRLAKDSEAARIKGAKTAPLYRSIDASNIDPIKAMKYVLFASQGVQPVEPNPEFENELRAAAGNGGVILYCEAGGTVQPTLNFPIGKASRSLQAAYLALNNDLLPASSVLHLERGIYGAFQAGLDIEGEYKPQTGRTPNAAVDPTFKHINQERGYEVKEGDKVVEPEKKKFLGLF